jgi:hypothetical protein
LSTHASVIVKDDGLYVKCYVHFDGYPTHTGRVLLADFNSQDSAVRLAKMGMVEGIKLGGFINQWEDKDERNKPTYGSSITEMAKDGPLHVYVFENGAWTYDKITISSKTFRRSKKWKFTPKPLASAILKYQRQLDNESL